MHCAMSDMANQDGGFDRALAALRKIPRPILVVLVAFALGLGANTALFTLGYSQFLGLYPHPDELVVLRSQMQGHDDGVSAGGFIRWREQTPVFQDLHASTEGAFRIATQDGPEYVAASLVTTGFVSHDGRSLFPWLRLHFRGWNAWSGPSRDPCPFYVEATRRRPSLHWIDPTYGWRALHSGGRAWSRTAGS